MENLIYMSNTSEHLVEQYLKEYTLNNSIALVVSKKLFDLANNFKESHCEIERIIVLDDDLEQNELKKYVEETGIDKIVFSADLKRKALRFVESTKIFEIEHLYETFRKLWLSGIREIQVFDGKKIEKLCIPHLLDELVDRHKGRRCFVVGNGPSLNKIDMNLLKNEITLGANRCYIGYEKWGFNFTYWGFGDRLQVEEYGREYELNIPDETIKFFPFEYLPWLRFQNSCPVNFIYNITSPHFSPKCDKIYLGYSMVHFLMQVAVIMGCNPIILVGADHNYELRTNKFVDNLIKENPLYQAILSKGLRNRKTKYWSAVQAKKETHFDSKYTKGNKKFLMPNPQKAEECFAHAYRWAKLNHVEILNATPGSKLSVFPMVDFNTLF